MPQNKTRSACTLCDNGTVNLYPSLWTDKRLKVIIFSSFIFFLGLFLDFIFKFKLIASFLFLATFTLSGYEIVKKGVFAFLFQRRITINFLVSLAAVGSLLIGHLEEGAAVVYLFYIAEFLEFYSNEKARRSVNSLMKLSPETAIVKKGKNEVEIPVEQVEINDVVIVKPGERIPLDGIVVKGASTVNQASITGESLPVTKIVGDQVYAGTINYEGYLEIKVTKKSTETLISRIINLVKEAQRNQAPIERFVDKFSRYYTPIIVLLAAVLAAVPVLFTGRILIEWVYRALILLVVACPCALAISTPVAMVSAVTNAAKNGVLIKSSKYVEELSKAKVVAFDKTGTLTKGKLEVINIISFEGREERLLGIAASIEALSEHPIAEAILRKAKRNHVELFSTDNFKAFPGEGVFAEVNGERFYIGNKRMLNRFFSSITDEIADIIEKLENEGKTVVIIGNEKKVLGLVAVRDEIKDSAVKSIEMLKEKEIKSVMLTGDNERAANVIAKRLEFDYFYTELLPEDKVKVIRKLAGKFGHVVMVGDGVNDAPALAMANVGIAMGAIGSDIALETADIALMEDELSKIPYLIDLCKKTLKIVKENIFASVLVKGVFVVLAVLGLINLWLAVAIGDMGLSLAVIFNALRLSGIRAD